MNRARLLAGIAGFLLFVGIGQLLASPLPGTVGHTFTVAPGYEYHIFFSYLFGAPVSLSYQVTSAGNVDVYLLTDSQYVTYRGGGGLTALTSSDSNSGALSYSLPTGGTYHVIVRHAVDSTSLTLAVSVTMHYSGIAPTAVYIGVGILALAAVLAFVAARMRAKRAGLPLLPDEEADSRGVTYFEEPVAPAKPPGEETGPRTGPPPPP